MKSMILVTGPTGNMDWNHASHPLHTGAAVRASTDSFKQQVYTAAPQIVLKPAA
jgi:hypothetical protein